MSDDPWEDTELSNVLRPPAPDAQALTALEERTVRTLREQGLLATAAPGSRRVLALQRFAAAAALLAVGYLSGRWPATTPTAPEYLLLLRQDAAFRVPDEGDASLVREYTAWARELRRAGRLVAAEELEDGVSLLPDAAPSPTTGGSRISGFFLVTAPDDAAARAIALDCPHLRHGGQVELRKLHGSS